MPDFHEFFLYLEEWDKREPGRSENAPDLLDGGGSGHTEFVDGNAGGGGSEDRETHH